MSASQMTDENPEDQIVQGVVKWFDPSKGFGFVVAGDGGPDILLHANVLRNFGQSSIADSAIVQIAVQETGRGLQATAVLRIDPPAAPTETNLEEEAMLFDGEGEAGPLEPARVKWFDKAKGFGFANVFGRPEDVFVHVEILRRSGLADLQPGEAVGLRVIEGKRGRMATVVTSWETALRDDDGA